MVQWNVYTVRGQLIDQVFFNKDCDAQYVRDSLIGHDMYPSNIIVAKAKQRRK